MHGAGNDFVLVDGRNGLQVDWPELARRMCDRHFGVGSDGLLLVLPSHRADFRMDMWNPDGSAAEMCGNGIRCFARYLLDGPARGRQELSVETGAGVLTVRARGSTGWLQVSMGGPVLDGRDIPVDSDENPVLHLALPELGFEVACVSMGNPHAVCFVPDVDAVDLEHVGPLVERHRLFPQRVNFHVCQVVGLGELKMRSWERGAGLTLACGTGASATAVAARLLNLTDSTMTIHVPGGRLELEWDGQGEVYMTGPAAYVF
ncbi:MAG: diaminopimelate epimerase, partial [Chloroflexota bacterium]|nr:diaminopimelate epimerase [Chloroflexota bacterium]